MSPIHVCFRGLGLLQKVPSGGDRTLTRYYMESYLISLLHVFTSHYSVIHGIGLGDMLLGLQQAGMCLKHTAHVRIRVSVLTTHIISNHSRIASMNRGH